jgi:hypothetical protein
MGMTYRLTAFGKTRLPLPGVPWRDLTVEEFGAAKARHPGIENQGYFEQAEDEPPVTKKSEAVTPAEETHDG